MDGRYLGLRPIHQLDEAFGPTSVLTEQEAEAAGLCPLEACLGLFSTPLAEIKGAGVAGGLTGVTPDTAW